MMTADVPALPAAIAALPDAQLAAIAAGEVQPAGVLHWQRRARALRPVVCGCALALHHWEPPPEAPRLDAAPVLLLHGGSGSWTHWVRSLRALTAAGHSVWALDLPGFGDSATVPGAADVDALLPVLATFLRDVLVGELTRRPVQILGFSLGAMTAAMLAAHMTQTLHGASASASAALAQFPVTHMVLSGPPGMGLRPRPAFQLQAWRHLDDPRAQLARHVFNLGELMLADPAHITPDTLALHVANVRRDRLPRRRLSHTDVLLRALAHAPCPVTALFGEHDRLYPRMLDQVQQRLHAATAQFRAMHRIAGAGHWVQHEAPQAFSAALLPLLADAGRT